MHELLFFNKRDAILISKFLSLILIAGLTIGWGYCPSPVFVEGMLLNSCMSLECSKTATTEKSRRKKFKQYILAKSALSRVGISKLCDERLQLSNLFFSSWLIVDELVCLDKIYTCLILRRQLYLKMSRNRVKGRISGRLLQNFVPKFKPFVRITL